MLFAVRDLVKSYASADGTVPVLRGVSGASAREMARTLARREGLFAGFSAGANVAAALDLLRARPGLTVGVILCDSGLKYLSTGGRQHRLSRASCRAP